MTDLLERLREALASRYRVERELGAGGMAVVFLAEDLRHHRPVAVKVLRPELAAEIGSERFVREIDTAARLTHPHILPLLDSGAAGGFLYYVMPYVEGESLRGRLTREKQLPLDDALRIAREVADALSYAHSRDVVHRDIKPENILLQSGHAVVADFGIARAIAAAGGPKLTSTGVMVGTPLYMSPEQALGERELDGRTDVYSLGCVMYEMLGGEPPFTGPSAEVVRHQHLSVEAPLVTTLRPAVPVELARAVGRALAKLPADRYATAVELAGAMMPAPTVSTAPPASTAPPVGEAASVASTTPVGRAPPARRFLRFLLFSGAALIVVAGVLLVLRPGRQATGPPGPGHARSEIAVLPFQNLSVEGPHAYFAGGLHDELLTQLAKVAALKVISRTSVMGYQGTSKPLKTIAAELGVGSVVEGSVQVAGGRLRVNVQLIDAATDEHLWAERYDRTLDDAFAIQSEVAQQIVTAVGAMLTGAEQERLTAGSTANAEAYRLYLRGRDYQTRPGNLRQNLEPAEQLFERALELDPKFALAHAALSQVHGQMYWWKYDPSSARAARQREEAEAALRLAPDLPQAHMAMGLAYFFGRRDYRRALDEYAIALKGLPNDAEIWGRIGSVHRRLGNWNEASAAFKKAVQLDPRDASLFYQGIGHTNALLHRYPDAVRGFDRALSLAPDLHRADFDRGMTYLAWQGQLDTLRAVVNRLPKDESVFYRAVLLLYERNGDGLLQLIQGERDDVFGGGWLNSFEPSALWAAWAHQLRGDHPAARAAFDSARARLDSALAGELRDDRRVHAARGLTMAGLGRRDEALREARWLQRSVIYREDAIDGPALAWDRARILAQAGDAEAALDEIGPLLAGPSFFSVPQLRVDPIWDPIRDHPRYQALLAKYGTRAAK